ncbi:MAG: hypothetical protein ACKVI6_02415, partial [Candidatus Poseidoniales archaeon]
GSSEKVDVNLLLNGDIIYSTNGSNGFYEFELNYTGNHLFCFKAIDLTIFYENNNSYSECRTMSLDSSIYDSQLSTYTNDGLVSSDTLQVILQREGSQEIRWSRFGSDDINIIPPGDNLIILELYLVEGLNEFTVEIRSLDEIDEYSISLIKDSTSPIFSFSEVNHRNSPLNTLKQIEGVCEEGLIVKISNILEELQFICPTSGIFSLNISVPSNSGFYKIIGKTSDEANNEANYSIDVSKQDWREWVKEDIQNKGPMLNWVIAISSFVFIITAINVFTSKRKE